MNGKFLILALLFSLSLGWTGCTEDSFDNETSGQDLSQVYNARLVARISVKTDGLEVATPVSRANADGMVLSDVWYAIFNTATGNIVPSVEGNKMRHQTLKDKQMDFKIEEELPAGNYTVAFLTMVEGGDKTTVQPIESLNDTWLTAGEGGIVAGDFFHGQGTVTIAPEETKTLSVTLTRVSGLFSFTAEMEDEEQQQLIRETKIVLNQPLPYSAMSAGGKMIAANSEGQQTIDITGSGTFFALVSEDQPVSCEGNVWVALSHDTQDYERIYQLDKFSLQRSKRTTYTLNLNLPFNRLENLDQSAIIGERGRMLKTGESQASMLARHFKLQNPLTVTFNGDGSTATLQFYSPVGIGHTEVYARIKSTRDYFKVYELDTIRPFDEIKMKAALFNNEEGYYLTEKGGIVKIPAGINLSNDELEYKTVCKSDYWTMIQSIGINPTIRFNARATQGIETENMLTPRRARFIVGILLNWGVMLTSQTFMEALDEWPDLTRDYGDDIDVKKGKHEKFYWTDYYDNYFYPTPEEIKDRIYNVFGKADLRFGVHKRQGIIGGIATSEYVSVWEDGYNGLFTPYKGIGFYVYHELAHVLGYPDSYQTNHTTMAPASTSKGWTDICELIHSYMCSRNELPFSSPDVLDTIEE